MATRLSVCPRKALGAYYTPSAVARVLVGWSVRSEEDVLLDPSCGDGRFLALHPRAMGIERDVSAIARAHALAPHARIVLTDFFKWVVETCQRFESAAGNPPFIRYQQFSGETRNRALAVCARLGVHFSGLTSSWAPFLAAVTQVLKPGGRMAFVVPAEIGHAPYAAPLLEFLASKFAELRIVAIREKLFPELSEDAWLLFAAGHGASTKSITLDIRDNFDGSTGVDRPGIVIPLREWRCWQSRLRPFLVHGRARNLYLSLQQADTINRFSDVARIGIGYVTGDNDFFHLRPSQSQCLGISDRYLLTTVRNSKFLRRKPVDAQAVAAWLRRDDPVQLLRLLKDQRLPKSVFEYLNSPAGQRAKEAYKCRVREPWYVVPDVRMPDAFLSYMSGIGPTLVPNPAGCTCTNSVHAVTLKDPCKMSSLLRAWRHPLVELSAELEGHPLGGGMLKLEPREAARILLPVGGLKLSSADASELKQATVTLRRWRHYE